MNLSVKARYRNLFKCAYFNIVSRCFLAIAKDAHFKIFNKEAIHDNDVDSRCTQFVEKRFQGFAAEGYDVYWNTHCSSRNCSHENTC